jgi:hypothetical protein
MTNNEGPLPNDHTELLKVLAGMRLGAATTVGAFFTFQSGVPITRLGWSSDLGFVPVFLAPRGSEGRTPTVTQVDLRLSWTAQAGGLRPRVTLDMMNVTNGDSPLAVDNLYQRFSGRRNPNFGQPLVYQTPRTVRLGVELLF